MVYTFMVPLDSNVTSITTSLAGKINISALKFLKRILYDTDVHNTLTISPLLFITFCFVLHSCFLMNATSVKISINILEQSNLTSIAVSVQSDIIFLSLRRSEQEDVNNSHLNCSFTARRQRMNCLRCKFVVIIVWQI